MRHAPPARGRIVVVSSVERYRRLARDLPGPADAVLEIGCSTGEATRLLATGGARVVAVDVATEMVERARATVADMPRVTVAQVDGRDTPAMAALLADPDLVFVDIGGDARLDAVTLQLRQCLLAFAPRATVVRSAELAALCASVTDIEVPAADALGTLWGRRRSPDAQAHALESLLDLSHSASVTNRLFAARKLRDRAEPAARERMAQLADDPDARVRRIAVSRAPSPGGARRRSRRGAR